MKTINYFMLWMGLLLLPAAGSDRAGLVANTAVFRTAEGWLGLQVECIGVPSPAQFRLMFDVDGRTRGEPQSGADFMIEKGRFYRYPQGATDWSWDELPPPYVLQDDRTVTFVLKDVPFAARVKWHVDVVRPDWSLMSRFPVQGELEFDPAALPARASIPRVTAANMDDLLAQMPRTLSFRLDAEIKDRLWKPEPQAPGLFWDGVSNVPLKVILTDVVSGQQEVLALGEAAVVSNACRWSGRALDADWVLMSEPGEDGSLRLQALVSAAEARCLRIEAGADIQLNGWLWHDDVLSSRPLTDEQPIGENILPVPWGEKGVQSLYPLGVVSSDRGYFSVETEPEEPRAAHIRADAGAPFFGMRYDFALTPETSNFPGRAAFAWIFHSGTNSARAFRQALEHFYRRHPTFGKHRYPVAGALAAIDAGPWSYRLFVPSPFACNEQDVSGLLALRAAYSRLLERDLAAGALLGGARGEEGSRQLLCRETSAMVEMAVNVDPELPTATNQPLNRAGVEWSRLRGVLGDPRFQGIRLGPWDLLASLDYNPAAIRVADYPCVFDREVKKPALAAAFAAQDLLAPMSRLLHQHGKLLIARDPLGQLPFLMPWVDVIEKTVELSPAGAYPRPEDAVMDWLRAMAAQKPVLYLLKLPETTGSLARATSPYLRDALFRGFIPDLDGGSTVSTLSRLGAAERAAFATYQPLCRRLAAAGWNPVGEAQVQPATLEVESFGDDAAPLRQVTLRNATDADQLAMLILPVGNPCFAVNPLKASVEWLQPEDGWARLPVALRSGEVAVFDLVEFAAAAQEAAFLKSWSSGAGEASACQKNLENLLLEKNNFAVCRLAWPIPSVQGQANEFQLEVLNVGSNELSVSELKLITSRQFLPFDGQSEAVPPGKRIVLKGSYAQEDIEGDAWVEIQWALRRGRDEQYGSRLIRPEFVPPVEIFADETRVRGANGEAHIRLRAQNRARKEARLTIKFEGDFEGGRVEETLSPESVKTLSLPVHPGKAREGQVFVRVFSEGKQIFQSWYEVSFPGD